MTKHIKNILVFSGIFCLNSVAQAMMTTTSRQVKSLPTVAAALASSAAGSSQEAIRNYVYTPQASMSTSVNATDSLSAFKNSDVYKKMVADQTLKSADAIKNRFAGVISATQDDSFTDGYLKSLNIRIKNDDQDDYEDVIQKLMIKNAKELSKAAADQGYNILWNQLMSFNQFQEIGVNPDKLKPLNSSIEDGDIDAVNQYLKFGSKDGITGNLMYALSASTSNNKAKNNMQIIELLSKSIGNINQVDVNRKYSPFIAACLLDSSESSLDKEAIIKLFIQQGADVNQIYSVKSAGAYDDTRAALSDGNSPLLALLSVSHGDDIDLNCVNLLLKAGADANKANTFGQTPLMVVMKRSETASEDSTYPAIVELLKSHGAQETSTWAKIAMNARLKALYAGFINK